MINEREVGRWLRERHEARQRAIHHRALRCRPSKRDTYVTTHEALLAEAEYLQQTEKKINTTGLLHPLLVTAVCIAFLTLGWFA